MARQSIGSLAMLMWLRTNLELGGPTEDVCKLGVYEAAAGGRLDFVSNPSQPRYSTVLDPPGPLTRRPRPSDRPCPLKLTGFLKSCPPGSADPPEDYGAYPYWSPLLLAATHKDLDMGKELLAHGASLHWR
jgi:hypothetical protein